jgi:multicomponent Na+:H+ antiporter subunit G
MKELIICILLLSGSGFVLIASLGILRFKDLHSRMHATTKATSFGLLLLIGAAVLFFSEWEVYLKAVLIVVFIYLTAPLAAHSIARSYKNDEDRESKS